MNIFKRELRQELKPFLFWVLGIAILVLGGFVKFVGVGEVESGAMSGMLEQFPKPVLAMFGMAEANIETFGGFYSVIQFYAMIVISFYAIHLGTSSVSREIVDKTYEFLFTKPCGRLRILSMKLLAAFCGITLICVLNGIFSYAAPEVYDLENTIPSEMFLFALSMYLIGLFFFTLSAMLAVLLSRAERAVQLSNALLLVFYALSVVFDMDAKCEVLRFATPFKYFRASELLDGRLNVWYAAAIIIMSLVFVFITYKGYKKKDLLAL